MYVISQNPITNPSLFETNGTWYHSWKVDYFRNLFNCCFLKVLMMRIVFTNWILLGSGMVLQKFMYKMKQNLKKLGYIIVSQFVFNTTNSTKLWGEIPLKKNAPSTTQWQHSIVDINFYYKSLLKCWVTVLCCNRHTPPYLAPNGDF